MNFNTVPTLYLEPRILFLDDSRLFLDSVGNLLCDVLNVETSQNPIEVINRLKSDLSLSRRVKECIEYSDESSSKTAIINLDYKKLAKMLYHYYLANEYVSVVCIDYRMPLMSGLEVARQLKDLPLSRILLTGDIEKDTLIDAFDEGIITKVIHKTAPDLLEMIEEVTRSQHTKSIQALNANLFKAFSDYSHYKDLFSHTLFVSFYESILRQKQMAFSCVYEVGGSMLIVDRDGSLYVMNIYSESEIRYDLFHSEAYDTQISPDQKKNVEAFTSLIDYKTCGEQNRLNDLTNAPITDQFETYILANETYYVCFRPFDAYEKTLNEVTLIR